MKTNGLEEHQDRLQQRQKVFLRAKVLFNNRQSSMDCTMRDYSPRGAHLIFSDSVTVPDAIEVEIPHKAKILPAKVSWRKSGEVGVEWQQSAVEAVGLSERMHSLEVEMANFRRIISTLSKSSVKDSGI